VLVIPPPIGRYYFLDLRPGRSFVEYAVSQGLQVFMLSWRNPQQEQAEWGIDTYAARIKAALESVQEITGSSDVNTIGFCAGGIVMSTLLSHLAATDSPLVHSASYGVTLLDFESEAALGAFSAPRLLELARRDSRRKGVISARSLGTVFAWMRPDDLVFNYGVNQWLMGETRPSSTSWRGMRTAPTCRLVCTSSSSRCSATTCLSTRVASRCSGRPSTCR